MHIKHEMRMLISTIHSLISLLRTLSWETDNSANEIDSIRKLQEAAGNCFDELYKELR